MFLRVKSCCFWIFLSSFLTIGIKASKLPYIIGGSEVDNISQFPYQLSLRIHEAHACGASIIHCHWALTAGHCLENNIQPEYVSFRAGSINRFEGGIIVNAEQYFIHPQYEAWTYDFDVAVVKTIEPFANSQICVLKLIESANFIEPGTIGTIAGWGYTEDGEYPDILRMLDVEIWDQEKCFDKWFGEITSNMFCAGGEVGFDSCRGDSGGALVANGVQVGIVSTGASVCGIEFPGVYTNITHPSIRSFIRFRTGV